MRIRFLTIVCPAIRQRTKTLLRMTAALAFLGVQASEAGLVQGVQPPDGESQLVDFAGDGWVIGSPSNPVEIIPDPSAPPWRKILTGVPQDAGGAPPRTHSEWVLIGPGPDWIDYHLELTVSDGWQFFGGAVLDELGNTIPGLSPDFTQPPGPLPVGLVQDFTFDPLPAGTLIQIVQPIACGLPAGCTAATLEIEQYATVVPVPAAVWLFGSGILGLVAVARRPKQTF